MAHAMPDDTPPRETKGDFPSTHWSQLRQAADRDATQYAAAIDFLLQRYWKPVYSYLRRKGQSEEDSKDLTQEFFTNWLTKDLFARADRLRGRFRSLLLSSLDHFVANQRRAERAQRRRPQGGVASLDALIGDEHAGFDPADLHTPEEAFERVWASDLLHRVLRHFEDECRINSKMQLFELFRLRIIGPALYSAAAPPLAEVAQRMGLTEEQAKNRIVTTRRAFQRLLNEEIGFYASKEELAEEVSDLFRILRER